MLQDKITLDDIVLKYIRLVDAYEYLDIAIKDSANMQYYSKMQNLRSLETEKIYIESMLKRMKASEDVYYSVFLKTGFLLGGISVKEFNKNNDSAVIGFISNSKYDKKYIAQALRYITVLLINNGVNRIEFKLRSDNVAAIEIVESFGGVQEGILREKLKNKANNNYYDEVIFSVLCHEFAQMQPA